MAIGLVSLDMAGTTIDEAGAVYAVLRRSVEQATGERVPDELLAAWSGTSKYEAIVGLLAALDADPAQADTVFAHFSDALQVAYADRPPRPLPGVPEALDALRASGVAVALQTGYTREVAEGLLDAVGWRLGREIDALVTTDEVAASRPAPYLVFRTMEATGVQDVAEVLVAGDTVNDLRAGSASGAALVVGVLSGAHHAARLGRARHTHLLDSVASIPALLEELG